MRLSKLIPALALAAGAAVPAIVALPAHAATTCRLELEYLDLYNVDESDGRDEVRLNFDGTLYPGGFVGMRNGDRAYPASFGNPSTTMGNIGSVNVSVREVTPPIVGGGTNLGSINASGALCGTLAFGQQAYVSKFITGTDDTYYEYYIRLVMTGL